MRLLEEKELVRLTEAERKAFIADQRRADEAEVEELVAESEKQLTHREAQERRLKHAESTVRRLEQEVKELANMIKKVGLDQDARHEELRSSADGLIQAQREASQHTVKPRLNALRRMQA